VYERFVVREQEHQDGIVKHLKALGLSPRVVGPAFSFAGVVSGKALDLMTL